MSREDNLIPCGHELTSEEKIRGGKASGEARRRRKLMREQLDMLLNLPVKSSKIKEQLKELGIENDDLNNQMALLIAVYQKALKGDVQAFNTLRDTVGEKPVDVQQVNATVNDPFDELTVEELKKLANEE